MYGDSEKSPGGTSVSEGASVSEGTVVSEGAVVSAVSTVSVSLSNYLVMFVSSNTKSVASTSSLSILTSVSAGC